MKNLVTMNEEKLYHYYTTTAQLADSDEKKFLDWSKIYFRSHYSSLLPINKNEKILEIGCGCGRYLKEMKDMGYSNIYGIDISEEQVQYAKNKLELLTIEKSDIVDWLSNKENYYECILALDVLEHLEIDYLMKAGESIYRSLKPGGRLIVQVPNGVMPLNDQRYGDLTHIRSFTIRSIRQFFLVSNLDPVGYYEIPPHIHNIQSFVRRLLWVFIVKPMIKSYMMVANGNSMGGIYTANFLAVAQKSK